jgi:ribose 5-phosphate isomerase A
MANDAEKEAAARASLKYVNDSQIVGLGSGSTATVAIRLIGERVRTGLKIRGIPTSIASCDLASQLCIPLTNFEEVQEIHVTIDGADEFDAALNLINGGGGAMLREKIVAFASRQLIIVADSSKQMRMLGKFPVPVEVIGFAERLIAKKVLTWARKLFNGRTDRVSPISLTRSITFSIATLGRSRIRRRSLER